MAVRLLRDADHRGWPSPFAEVVEVAEDAAHAGRRSLLAHYPRVPGSLKEGEGRGYMHSLSSQRRSSCSPRWPDRRRSTAVSAAAP